MYVLPPCMLPPPDRCRNRAAQPPCRRSAPSHLARICAWSSDVAARARGAADLQLNNVSPELRCHILEYYEYLYTSTQSMQDLRIYQDLPPALAMRLAITVHRRLLARCPALCALSDDALLGVLGRLKPRIYIPGQIIVVEGQEHRAIQFVKKGRVLLIQSMGTPDEILIRTVVQHDNFGLDLGHGILGYDDSEQSHSGRHRGMANNYSLQRFVGNEQQMSQRLTSQRQLASESARAETYCDVVSLDADDLGALVTKDRLWAKLSQSSTAAAMTQGGGTGRARAGGAKGRWGMLRSRYVHGGRVQPTTPDSTGPAHRTAPELSSG